MSRLSLRGVLTFLHNPNLRVSPNELELLQAAVKAIEQRAEAEHAAIADAQEKANAAARAAGFKDVYEMLGIARTDGSARAPRVVPITRQGLVRHVRKPYMIPSDPNRIFSVKLSGTSTIPEKIKVLLDEGWALEDLHYKRLKLAAKARGVELNWDPVEQHAICAARKSGTA